MLKKSLLILLSFFAALFFSSAVFADAETDEIIQNVQKDLNDATKVQEATQHSTEAKAAHEKVHELAGTPQDEKDIYGLASDVFGNMKGKSMEQIIESVNQAQKNPEAFANSWSPEQRKKLRELSERLPASHPKAP